MIRKLLFNSSIVIRLIIAFTITSLIPLMVIGIFTYIKTVDSTKVQTFHNRNQLLQQVSRNIQFFMKDMENLSLQIFEDEDLQSVYSDKKTSEDYASVMSLQRGFYGKYLSVRKEISTIAFYPEKGIPFSLGEIRMNTSVDYKKLDIYKDVKKYATDHPVWLGTHLYDGLFFKKVPIISYGAAIYKMRGSLDFIGVLEFQFKEEDIEKIYKETYIKNPGFLFLTDQKGLIVSTEDKSILCKKLPVDIEQESLKKHDGYLISDYNGIKYLITYTTMDNIGWKLYDFMPYETLIAESKKINDFIIIIAVICLIMSLVLSVTLSIGITRPIKSIVRLMREVERGNLDVELTTRWNDEVGQLGRSFIKMVKEIKNLIYSVERKEEQKKYAEITALQAQISPHFLYNTLNSIKCMAAIHGDHDIEKMTSSLINLMKISVSNATGFVSLLQEINCVKEYVELQKYRYGNCFDIEYVIDPKVVSCKFPKLILLTMVENSLIHGLDPMETNGKIAIKAYEDGDELQVSICDNGKGFSQEVQEHIFETETGEIQSKQIGLRNVNERIKLYFGDKYGVKIISEPCRGAEIIINMPKLLI